MLVMGSFILSESLNTSILGEGSPPCYSSRLDWLPHARPKRPHQRAGAQRLSAWVKSCRRGEFIGHVRLSSESCRTGAASRMVEQGNNSPVTQRQVPGKRTILPLVQVLAAELSAVSRLRSGVWVRPRSTSRR